MNLHTFFVLEIKLDNHNLLTIIWIKILIQFSVVLKNLYDYFYRNYFLWMIIFHQELKT